MPFVLDASVALAWCFEDEATPFTDAVLDRLQEDTALVPAIWPLEVGNVLWGAERRGRLTVAESTQYATLLAALPIQIHPVSLVDALGPILSFARTYQLTSYDAAYLVLASQRGLALASLDERVRAAAGGAGIALLA